MTRLSEIVEDTGRFSLLWNKNNNFRYCNLHCSKKTEISLKNI